MQPSRTLACACILAVILGLAGELPAATGGRRGVRNRRRTRRPTCGNAARGPAEGAAPILRQQKGVLHIENAERARSPVSRS